LIRFQSGINPTNSRKIPANRKTRDAHHRTQARIREAIEEQSCFVVDRPVPVAYAMMDHRFFGRAFVWMIYVAASHRRRGIGTELLTALGNTVRQRQNLYLYQCFERADASLVEEVWLHYEWGCFVSR